ncbi:MAG: cbb3-type cytochrome c oxidase subunit I, partial [Candidatus Geothermarchaeales archaeon]
TALFFFFLGGVTALLMRTELSATGPTIVSANTYQTLFTLHGTGMIFLFLIPMFIGFGNYFVPKLIGADDMAYPRLNALTYWMIPPAGALIWLSMAAVGWTGYAPLSTKIYMPGLGVDLWIVGLHLIGVSSILGGFNFVVTILKRRRPDLRLMDMSIFVWMMLVTSFLILAATPALATALTFLLLDRNLGTAFFLPQLGGDALLWQHLFWFYSHPAVYIMILPGMGLISEIIPAFARKRRIFGYTSMVVAGLLIGILGFGVWAHHMFTTGMSIEAQLPFMLMSFAIALPSGVKTFNWIATLYGGRIKLSTPMKFAVSFVATFVVAGITGVFQAAIPIDYALQDTYYVVGHLHWMLFGASAQSVFAALYYYFPELTGRKIGESLGTIHFVLTNVGLYGLLTAFTLLGLEGMPRRVFDYLPELADLNLLATVFAFTIALGQGVFLYNLVKSWLRGEPAGENPWQL